MTFVQNENFAPDFSASPSYTRFSASISCAPPEKDFSESSIFLTRDPKPAARKFIPSVICMKTGTSAEVPMPPKHERLSARYTSVPLSAAATAAATPAGPPPATNTSVPYFTGMSSEKLTLSPLGAPPVAAALAAADMAHAGIAAESFM